MNPYQVMGVKKNATEAQIKKAYRSLSLLLHPDVDGGDEAKFKELNEANKILMDPLRRKRYDETGRTDAGVTEEKVNAMVSNFMENVVNAVFEDGSTDNPVWDDIQGKMLYSIHQSRLQVQHNIRTAKKKVVRIKRLIRRFKPLQDHDPVGDSLRKQLKEAQESVNLHEDALELSIETEKVLRTYQYDVGGPDPEGQEEELDPRTSLRITAQGVSFSRR